jgi:hypothetical protein
VELVRLQFRHYFLEAETDLQEVYFLNLQLKEGLVNSFHMHLHHQILQVNLELNIQKVVVDQLHHLHHRLLKLYLKILNLNQGLLSGLD